MFKGSSFFFKRFMLAVDLVLCTLAFFLAYYLRNQIEQLYPLNFYIGLLPVFLMIWGGLLDLLGVFRFFRTRNIWEILFVVFKCALIGILIFSSVLYILKIENVSRILIFLSFSIAFVFVGIAKISALSLFRYFLKKGFLIQNMLLVGTGPRARVFMDMMEKHKEWGTQIIGLVDDEERFLNQVVKGYPVLGLLKDIPRIAHENVVDEVAFVVPGSWLPRIEPYIMACETEGIKVSVAVDFYKPMFSRTKLSYLEGIPMVIFENTPDKVGQLLLKRIFDIVFSSLALVFLWPVFLTIAWLVKKTSPGPVFFNQERCGLNGRHFKMYKFRTMYQDAEQRLKELLDKNEMTGPVFKIERDPRVTPLGRFLRKSSLDEIPQFWNVLKGDMSLIGPRPPIPSEVDKYDPWHRRRLRMRPGITCLWQVKGRNKIKDFNVWAQLDMQYIDTWSLWLDAKILLKTIPVVIFGIGAK